MHTRYSPENRRLGLGLLGLGFTLAAAAAVAGLAAVGHMARAPELCGPISGHCLICIAVAGSMVAAVGVIVAGAALLAPAAPVGQAVRG